MQENNTTAEKTATVKHAAAIEKRSELSHIDPRNITIVGLDTAHTSVVDHAAYDERATLPVSEEMIASIAAEGQLQPVRVYATGKGDGRRYIALNGRQRVKAMRAINERNASNPNFKPLLVRCEIDAAPDEKRIFRIGVAENEIRVDNPLLLKIEQAATMANVHKESRDAIARTFGVSLATISLWFKFWTSDREIKAAYKAGKITFTAALKLADMPQEQGRAALKALADAAESARQTNETGPNAGEDGETEGEPVKPAKAPKKASVADVKNAASGKEVTEKAPTRGELVALYLAFDKHGEEASGLTADQAHFLGMVLGERPLDKGVFAERVRMIRKAAK